MDSRYLDLRNQWSRALWLAALAAWLLSGFSLLAAPFHDLHLHFTQPDGTTIEIIGSGDEFSATFETTDGYTVVFDPARKAYCLAVEAADGQLISTGVMPGERRAQSIGVKPHERPAISALHKQRQSRRDAWERQMDIKGRWEKLKSAGFQSPAASSTANSAQPNGVEPGPPANTTIGNKLGLCLLIDFDDDPATIPQSEIINFCNADNYNGFGNFSSVKRYFQDVSNGLLTYSNVVTIYIRIPNSLHPKSYYNDTTKDCGSQGNLLIRDALNILKAMPNYYTQILPTFANLTVDGNNNVVACNVFYAGGNGNVWAKGLWPHSGALSAVGAQPLSPGGKKVYRYQITNIGSRLTIGTFCHENGHLLCGYPDLYDYDYDSRGGAGGFCLMSDGNYANGGLCPVQICAYLKRASGWATTITVSSNSAFTGLLTATAGTNFNQFYRFQKPGVNTEYFLLECRYKSGHDTYLPASGVAVWHVDELGDHNNQSLLTNSTHANYELTLVQADDRWDLENNRNDGDSTDLYYSGNTAAGYLNQLTDNSSPNTRWWDGTKSGASFTSFSPSGTNMTFTVGDGPIIVSQPQSLTVAMGENATFSVAATGGGLSYLWRFNGSPLSGATGSNYTRTNAQPADAGSYSVMVSNGGGSVLSATATLTVNALPIIHDQPSDVTTGPGLDATFSVNATSAVPLSYQWQFDGNNITDATNSAYQVVSAQSSNAGPYAVVVSNIYGSVRSADAVLSVRDPFIVTQPVSQAGSPGDTLQFSVSAVGAQPLAYQWQFNGVDLTGETGLSLKVTNAQVAQIGFYTVAVSNISGMVMSEPASLVLSNVPPMLALQPLAQTVPAASTVKFVAAALGVEPMSYQWSRGGANLSNGGKITGANGSALIITNAQAVDMGLYSLVASNAYGMATSSNVALRIWPVLGWGQDTYRQADVATGLTNVLMLAAGSYHSLALKDDGTVTAWGAGMTNSGSSPNYGQAVVPSTVGESAPTEIGNTVAIAAGAYHSLALKAEGKVVAWGAGITNSGINPHYGQANVPASLSNVVAIAAGGYHSLALKADGTVVAWGAGTNNTGISPHYGQAQVPAGLANVVAIAAGTYHSLALKSDGTVVAWGANPYGQTNVPAGLSNVVSIASGTDHCLALRADGTVVAWGRDTAGQADVPTGLGNVVAISGGLFHSAVLESDGTVAAWGGNTAGQTMTPFGLANVVALAAGGLHNLAIESDGRPGITVQPVSRVVDAGSSASLTVLAAGAPPLRYQWFHGGTAVPGGTSNTLVLASVEPVDVGDYSAVVTNDFGAAASATATLSLPGVALIEPQYMAVNGNFECTVAGEPGQSYVILASTNLINWQPVQTNTSPFSFTDVAAGSFPVRFYRAQKQQ